GTYPLAPRRAASSLVTPLCGATSLQPLRGASNSHLVLAAERRNQRRDHGRALSSRRAGITLMEVIVALAIFLISFVAIGMLMNAATARAHEARTYTIAMQLAQSKLSEFVAGVQPMSTTGEQSTPFDFDPKWVWSAKCDVHPDANVTNLFL